MNNAPSITLAESIETGSTGICHLKRLWGKAMTGQELLHEQELDNAIINILGLGLLPTYQFLFEHKPSFELFEQWVLQQSNGAIDLANIERCNSLVAGNNTAHNNLQDDVLSATDIDFWNKNGYVIIKQAISPQDCAAAARAIWDHLEMDEHDCASWYKHSDAIQGIMVPLYRHPAMDKNRNAPKIRRAFEQLWQRSPLIVTTDKCGFNPPETELVSYRGIGLHWDVSLATPIPFGTQGILYLTDTASNQGALTVIPGFHKTIENWLAALPKNVNPREVDLSAYNKISIAANAGDFIIWNHALPHSSSPNNATLPRLVQYINWYDPLQKAHPHWL
ncbi:MAG: phytanoyl-CoA dioxygenase [Sphingobacteriales bacterium]|nr:MAG: phytanoyl-CoA dioxygenase [Sphingobacteriales bacterium]